MTLLLPNISFVATPKTATISIETAFSPYARDYAPHVHEPVNVVRSKSNKPALGVIRNPHDWIKSYYLYLKHSKYFLSVNSPWGIGKRSLDSFVGKFCDGQHLWPEPLRLQSDYLETESDSVEHLYRYESLNLAIAQLNESCGTKVVVDRHNVSPKSDLVLSHKMKTLFEESASKDFELYEK
jgi:hypothetical protein